MSSCLYFYRLVMEGGREDVGLSPTRFPTAETYAEIMKNERQTEIVRCLTSAENIWFLIELKNMLLTTPDFLDVCSDSFWDSILVMLRIDGIPALLEEKDSVLKSAVRAAVASLDHTNE
ncbi:MAG: hypothetical protein KGJ59_07840 [Bacteroidota bacterium]|nr:hypothetical protein [Bacteroidota bacterium]